MVGCLNHSLRNSRSEHLAVTGQRSRDIQTALACCRCSLRCCLSPRSVCSFSQSLFHFPFLIMGSRYQQLANAQTGGARRMGNPLSSSTGDAILVAAGASPDEIHKWHDVETAYWTQLGRRSWPSHALNCHLAVHLALHDASKPYRSLPLGARHQKIAAHVAAYMVNNVVLKPTGGLQVSHLCHNGGCVNPDHLLPETRAENLARNMCQGWKLVTCPCPCAVRFNPCPHQPQCLLRP